MCRVALLKLQGEHKLNSGIAMSKIKGRMEIMQHLDSDRD